MKSKIVCSILLFIFFFSFSHTCSQYLHSEKRSLNKFSLTDTNKIQLKEKSPLLAGSLSFVVPGFALGQFYNEEYNKFFTHLTITAASVLGAVLGLANITIGVGGQTSNENNNFVGFALFYISAGVFTVNWIWSIVDAVSSANNINKQIKLQKYRSDVLDNIKLGITLDKNKNLNLKFAFEL